MLRAHSNKESRACLSVRFPELEKRLEIGSRTKYKMIERMRERCSDPFWSERIATWPELHPPTHFVLFGKSLPYVTAKILTWFDTDIHPKSEKLCGISLFSFLFSPKIFAEKVCKSQRQCFATKVRKSSKLWTFCVKRTFKNIHCYYIFILYLSNNWP